MNERDLENKVKGDLVRELSPSVVWKIRDEVTGGQPDLEVAWNGYTTKLEFKVLKPGETVHDKWEDERQLIMLHRYEQATTRAWVVAFVKDERGHVTETRVYRPSRLLRGARPTSTEMYEGVGPGNITLLWSPGVLRLKGFNPSVITALIKQTHQ